MYSMKHKQKKRSGQSQLFFFRSLTSFVFLQFFPIFVFIRNIALLLVDNNRTSIRHIITLKKKEKVVHDARGGLYQDAFKQKVGSESEKREFQVVHARTSTLELEGNPPRPLNYSQLLLIVFPLRVLNPVCENATLFLSLSLSSLSRSLSMYLSVQL